MNSLLIAGTDTDVGKTVVTSALVAYWQRYCAPRRLGLMKPIQTGSGDRELFQRLFPALEETLEQLNPLHFQAPLAPPIAADHEQRSIDLETVWSQLQALQHDREFVLLEALGGLGSPITHEMTVADLAWEWRLPIVLIVPVRLGAIAQAVANVALARQARVHLKGLILNCVQPRSEVEIQQLAPSSLLQSLTNVPVLGCLPYLANPTDIDKLAQVASDLNLESLLPLCN